MILERIPFPRQGGLTLVEIVVALAILGIAGLLFGAAYRGLSRGATEIAATADMQLAVKAMGTELESDLKRAGFGLGGAPAFNILGAREVSFSYRDLPGSACAAGEMASIRYSLRGNALARDLSCGGSSRPRKLTEAGTDSLALSFRYLDDAGNAAAASERVRTVEFSVALTSGRGPREGRRQRVAAGSVSIVNNR